MVSLLTTLGKELNSLLTCLLTPARPLTLTGTLHYLLNLLFCGLLLLVFYAFITNNFFVYTVNQQYSELAKALIKGRTYFISNPSYDYPYADCTSFNGKYFWPLGIFPAVLLIPLSLVIKDGYVQGVLSGILTTVNFLLLFHISRKITGSSEKSLYLSAGYLFASAYYFVGIQPASWYLAHVVVTFCLSCAIYFTAVRPTPLFAGLFFTFSFLSRISTAFGIAFFVYLLLTRNRDLFGFKKDLLKFLLPVILGIALFCTYNNVRFRQPLETGYKHQLLFTELVGNRNRGMWSLSHFPANIYYLLFKGPEAVFLEGTKILVGIYPNSWGMGILFTTPVLLYLVFADTNDRVVRASLYAVLPILLFLLGSFGIGAYQYGYRFALDFQPFLFLILFRVFKYRKFDIVVKLIVITSVLFNIYMGNVFFDSGVST